jgi:hypothetical protein
LWGSLKQGKLLTTLLDELGKIFHLKTSSVWAVVNAGSISHSSVNTYLTTAAVHAAVFPHVKLTGNPCSLVIAFPSTRYVIVSILGTA